MGSILSKPWDLEWVQGKGVTPNTLQAINDNFDVIFRDLSGIGFVTRGDLVIGDEDAHLGMLGIGASGTVLSSDGTDPAWSGGPFTFTDLTITDDLVVGDDVTIAGTLSMTAADGEINMTGATAQLLIGTDTPPTSAIAARIYVLGNTSSGANLDLRAADAITVATIEVQAHDYETSFQAAYLQYIGSGIAGNLAGFSPAVANADLVMLRAQNASNFVIDTTTPAPIIFGINGAEVARCADAVFTVAAAATLAVTSTSASALDVAGGAQFGSGNVALIGTDGRINGPLSSTIIDDLSGANLTGLPAANLLISGQTTGDLLTASSATVWSRLADVATGSVLISGGVGVVPAWTSTPTFSLATLTGTPATAVQDTITRTGTITSGTWSASFGAVSGATLTGLVEANITDGAILARVAGNETISGTWTFSNALAWGGGAALASSTDVLTDG